MKPIAFISYSTLDDDKVKVMTEEIETTGTISALVIAQNREPLKPLARKVSDGIQVADFFLPIITKNSMGTQWLNQEIGYATALNKRIIPLVEKEIISSLKGFIHKEIDLPYLFVSSAQNDTPDSFYSATKTLVNDIISSLPAKQFTVSKSPFELSLEKATERDAERKYKQEKDVYLESQEALHAAQNEMLNQVFPEIRGKIKTLIGKNMSCATEEDNQEFSFKVNCEGFNFFIQLELPYVDSLVNSVLRVNYLSAYASPNIVREDKYKFDRNKNGQIGWMNKNNGKFFFSKEIIEEGFTWVVNQVTMKRNGVLEL